jgi:hypothetical protein
MGNNQVEVDGFHALAQAAALHPKLRFMDIRDNPTWGVPTPAAFADEFKQVAPCGFTLVTGTTKDGTEIKWTKG